MRKIGIRSISNINLDLLPITLVIADFFASGANRQQAAEGFDLSQGVCQFLNQPQPLGFLALAFADIQRYGLCPNNFAVSIFDGRDRQ